MTKRIYQEPQISVIKYVSTSLMQVASPNVQMTYNPNTPSTNQW